MATYQQTKSKLDQDFLSLGEVVHTERWQGMDIKKQPAARMVELLNVTTQIPLQGCEELDYWREVIQPFLPWADDHFEERVCGFPLNPGNTWDKWRHGASAARFIKNEIFNHTYMERLWPKFAGQLGVLRNANEAEKRILDVAFEVEAPVDVRPNHGIRFQYGDLANVVELLEQEPLTRQAWIPLFFPEDTGIGDGDRKPCTLGYQFIMRNERLHLYYPLRSCDYFNHFDDDVYLAIRLLLWMLEQLRTRDAMWDAIHPGTLTIHATSLHCFINDFHQLRLKV